MPSVPPLPQEIVCHVMQLALGLRELYIASRVCRSWEEAACEDRNRRRVLEMTGSHRPPITVSGNARRN